MGIAQNNSYNGILSSRINGKSPVFIVDDAKNQMSRITSSASEAMQVAQENGASALDMCSTTKNKTVKGSLPGETKTKILSQDSSISYGNVDKRVSLTCAPKVDSRDERTFANKIIRVLGERKFAKNWIKTGNYFYGLLHNALSGSSGLIFPYTPEVQFTHKVNWESTDITHSNLTYSAYKNTPVPDISLNNCKFTADNRDNALHMLSAIWFLVACTKCEFGEKSNEPGLPPPILYLNGYDHLIDNIPVVVTNVSYKYPSDKHYVNLVLDMSKDYNANQDFCKIYDTTTVSETSRQYSHKKYIGATTVVNTKTGETYEEGEPRVETVWDIVPGTKPTVSSHTNGIDLSFWLPTSLDISIGLKLQPNLLKTKKQWKLADYKSGLLMHNRGKNPPVYSNETVSETVSYNTQQLAEGVMGMCPVKTVEKTEDKMEFIPSGWTW